MSKPEGVKSVEDLLASIEKSYGKGSVILGTRVPGIEKRSSGILSFDLALGGGFGKGKIVEVFGPESSGKALSLDSKILTPNGWTTMGNIKVGDAVVTDGGYTEYVKEVYPQGVQPTFELKLKNGHKVKCTLDHLWEIYELSGNSKQPYEKVKNFSVYSKYSTATSVDSFVHTTAEILHKIERGVDVFIPYYDANKWEDVTYKNQDLKNLKSYSKVVSITRVEDVECQCIALYGVHSKLFITDDYILTHNTTISIHAMAQAQKDEPNKYVAIIDAEHALDSEYCAKLGLDLSKTIICQPDYGEQGTQIAIDLIESGHISFLLLDSLAALVPKSTIDGEMEDAQMGVESRMIGRFLKKVTASANNTGTTLYMTNQIRMKLGTYGNPETTPGGQAPRFYASQRIQIRAGQNEKEGAEVKNKVVNYTVIKNKIAAPFKKGTLYINFGTGVDKVRDLWDAALRLGVINVTGRTYTVLGVKLSSKSKDDAYETFSGTVEIHDETYKTCIDLLKDGTGDTQEHPTDISDDQEGSF